MVYYCLRCGDLQAALQSASQAGQGLAEMAEYLSDMLNSPDRRLSPHSENLIRLSYRRSVRSTTDPFKRAVYCILGACDPSDEHGEIATSLDDYLWIKLSQIRAEDQMDGPNQETSLALSQLQSLMLEEYGESHFNAYEQPLLYFQVSYFSQYLTANLKLLLLSLISVFSCTFRSFS